MLILRSTDKDFHGKFARLAAQSSLFDADVERRTAAVVAAVRERGDAAILELTARFDGAQLTPDLLAVTTSEKFNASLLADEELRAAVAAAHRNIQAFSKKALRKGWTAKNAQKARVGEKFDPLTRVGIYIPGGTAPLVSTALMTVTLAKTAGCPEIVVCTPPNAEGRINTALLYALNVAGATEVYRVGGAQAIAAMACGTATIKPVLKIFGPGNAYVVAAKRMLFGRVGIDLLPGPSEVLVLADESADPGFIAADLLAQAEHGSGRERAWLITVSAKILRGVEKEIRRQISKRARREFIETALESHGALIQVDSLDEAVALANQLAPEHVEIMTKKPRAVAERIRTAGAIFIGPNSPTVLGDYLAGPSHTLPTGGAAASFSGLTVDQFQRRTSVVEYDRQALRRSAGFAQKFAAIEGLDAHGHSAAIRLGKRR